MNYRDFFKDAAENANGFALEKEALLSSEELFEDHFAVAEYWK
jgi:hypothetical protein